LDNLPGPFKVFEQGSPGPSLDYFPYRASHVDIQNIRSHLFYDPGRIGHGLRPGPEDLHDQRAFFRAGLQKSLAFLAIPNKAFGTDHLSADQSTSLLFSQKAER
jgi:hypothetical protein